MHGIGHFTLGALASLTLASANAESTGLPAETNVRGADTPRIHPDGAITSTLNAPAANGPRSSRHGRIVHGRYADTVHNAA
jgi:hypothetical protein